MATGTCKAEDRNEPRAHCGRYVEPATPTYCARALQLVDDQSDQLRRLDDLRVRSPLKNPGDHWHEIRAGEAQAHAASGNPRELLRRVPHDRRQVRPSRPRARRRRGGRSPVRRRARQTRRGAPPRSGSPRGSRTCACAGDRLPRRPAAIPAFANGHVLPALADFRRLHPKIEVKLSCTNRNELAERESKHDVANRPVVQDLLTEGHSPR